MDVLRIPGYDLLGRIGAGASAQVWRARRIADDLDVALKVVPTGAGEVSDALREAGILARMRHQHVIHLFDVLPVPGEGGRPAAVALAMELADGGSLGDVLAAREHLTPGELVTVCSPVASALAELHRAGVVHGDVSTGNVLFRSDGMPLLSDLGASRIAGDRRGQVSGTDGMVAPEVLEGFTPSAESDIYAVGALAWRCLVGEVPGWVGTRGDLAELRPELPLALVELVTNCLAADPSDRPEAEELAVALFAVARPEPIELAPGADPAAGLTQRIRADVRADPDADPDDESQISGAAGDARRATHPRALHREAASGRRGGSGRSRRSPREVLRNVRDLDRRGTGQALRRNAGVIVSGVVAVAVVAFLVVPWIRSVVTPDDSVAASAGAQQLAVTPSSPEPDPDPSATVPEPGSSARDTDSSDSQESAVRPLDPEAQPETAVQQLLDVRAAAWRSGDPADLAEVHAAGSPAYEQEVEALARASDLQVSYQGLRFTVEEATVVDATEDRLVLEAGVERSTYEAVTPSGRTSHPGRTDVVQIELRRSDGAWRIWGWS
ncbi:serine/threonine-protein kinase [Ornithinimicrobium cryptoxanthini]|uniref:Serine/threonine protein kinase n=1 Tax=Ornithinimicrobium cryptoxanthini TaxID=2934161 RepID=A0ABY4YL46_9MICO|nr:serine/threonine-protein kinase [Ornithinimicrobium cryptoxanthini]USQ77516.1 serine/threonine protein kinase [Ornithinimicrobium cryptoxanthini]